LGGIIPVSTTRTALSPDDQHYPATWPLQDAKARFSELVRRARAEGPQHVTVRGREEVVMISAEEFQRLSGGQTGAALIAAMQSCPYPEVSLEPSRGPRPVRDVVL
jgi:prevent-host-death family protein